MKKIALLFTGLLIGLTTVSATEQNNQIQNNTFKKNKGHRYTQPIMFVEHGIKFSIFPDGSFDFNTNNRSNIHYNPHYKHEKSRRSNVNTTYRNTRTKGTLVSRSRNGEIKRIGNLYLNYNRYGKIIRIGDIYMNYNCGHLGDLRQVGGLHVNYNHWGKITNTYGQVNKYANHCNINNSYNNRDYRHSDDRRKNNNHSQNHYYKQKGNSKKQKKNRQ